MSDFNAIAVGDYVEVVKGRLVAVGTRGEVVRIYYPRSYGGHTEQVADIAAPDGSVTRVTLRFLKRVTDLTK